jgi:ribosomal-protein-alanine N-acetyltransferase
MRKEDVPQVDEIAREAFPEDLPPPSFKRALQNRFRQWFFVACEEKPGFEAPSGAQPEETQKGAAPGAFSWMRGLLGFDRSSSSGASAVNEHILGYAGLQMSNNMGHIVDIAVRKEYRRRGIGEFLLRSVIEQAVQLNTTFISLEVRVSNRPAQALYEKYGFNKVEARPGYYLDRNGLKEDGYYMSTERITSASYQALLQQLKQAYDQRWGSRCYSVIR